MNPAKAIIALTFATLAVTVLILFLTAGTAVADSPQFGRFVGSLSTAGGEIGGATLVTAVIEGREYHTHTATTGDTAAYSITIVPPQGQVYSDGTSVRFKIDGQPTEQVGYFQTGANVRLDLTASVAVTAGHTGISSAYMAGISSENSPSVSWATIAGVLMAALATAAITYYVILVRRAMRKGLLRKRATSSPVIARQRPPSSTQTHNR